MKRKLFSVLRAFMLAAVIVAFVQVAVSPAHAATDQALRQALIQSCIDGEKVNVSDYEITVEELDELFWELSYSGRLPWYAGSAYRYTYNEETGHVLFFFPDPLDETQYDRTLYEQKVAEVIAAAVHSGMTDWQMALSVHDYLIARCTYDESLKHNTGYDLLVNGTTVCSGYAQAYMDIMTRLGLECVYVVSEEMEHAWNLLKIGGSWYHVDLTWDDPSPNSYGTVLHKYFLISDREMLSEGKEGHYGWETDITCTSELLQNTFWKDANSQICYLDNRTSFVRSDDGWDSLIRIRDEMAGQQSTLYTVEEEYINVGAGEYAYSHAGLSLWSDRLYFSSTDTVYSMALDGSDLVTEYQYDTITNGKYIYGSFVENDTLYLTLSDHDFNQTDLEIPLEATGYHVHSYTAAVKPATCLYDGQTVHSCGCGITFTTDLTKASGRHSYESTVISEPTLFEEGMRRYTCISCNDTYIEDIPKLSFFEWLFDLIRSWFSW